MIDVTKKRLGPASERAQWLRADITNAELEHTTYDVWHDREISFF